MKGNSMLLRSQTLKVKENQLKCIRAFSTKSFSRIDEVPPISNSTLGYSEQSDTGKQG